MSVDVAAVRRVVRASRAASYAAAWAAYWRAGAFVDLGGAAGGDPDARELERRVVRSPRGTWVVEYTTELRTERKAVEAELRKELASRPVTGGEIKRFVDDLRARAKVEKGL